MVKRKAFILDDEALKKLEKYVEKYIKNTSIFCNPSEMLSYVIKSQYFDKAIEEALKSGLRCRKRRRFTFIKYCFKD